MDAIQIRLGDARRPLCDEIPDHSTVLCSNDTESQQLCCEISPSSFASDSTSVTTIGVGREEEHREWLGLIGYKILKRLEANARSMVYLVRRFTSGQRMVIKLTSIAEGPQSSLVSRFRLEARLLSAFSHPNLVKAHGFGRVQKIHYMLLDYVEGPNLKQLVAARGPLSIPLAAQILCQAASGLAYAHRHGVIHRDVKPANLVLSPNGLVKVLDLGLARVPDSVDPSVTLVCNDRLLGTPDFIAPEQILDSHKVDARSDIYGLGCTMYYLLAGTTPFMGQTMMERLLRHQISEATPLYLLRRDVPQALSDVCSRMMAKRPEDRFPSMNEVREALATWAGSPTVATGECHGK
jgi:serine/threonine protein kinase